MTTLWLYTLQTVIQALVGSFNYERVKALVENADTTALTGAEKRAAVIQEARTVGLAVGTALLNLAIEVAVQSLRK